MPGSILIHPELTNNIVLALPADVQNVLMYFGGNLCVAGGFCRDAFIGETPKDIDIFSVSAEIMAQAILWFKTETKHYELVKQSANSINFQEKFEDSVAPFDLPPVQFVNRCFYPAHGELIQTFDWSVCQIAVYYIKERGWEGICTQQFGEDIQSETLHYTAPERDEDPGASVLRMMRFTQRGWKPTEDSIARCLGRFAHHVAYNTGEGSLAPTEEDFTKEIKVCFRNVGYAGKGKKSESFLAEE